MKIYEVHVYASYQVNDHEEFNCFKDYTEAGSEEEAKAIVKAALEKDGYSNIELNAIVC